MMLKLPLPDPSSAGQYRKHFSVPFSSKPVTINTACTLFSLIMRQNAPTVSCLGPIAAMYLKT